MSESVSNAEVEDVLASIRRLVSEDPRPARTKAKAKPEQVVAAAVNLDKLLLTPSLRVAKVAEQTQENSELAEPEDLDPTDLAVMGSDEGPVTEQESSDGAEDENPEAWQDWVDTISQDMQTGGADVDPPNMSEDQEPVSEATVEPDAPPAESSTPPEQEDQEDVVLDVLNAARKAAENTSDTLDQPSEDDTETDPDLEAVAPSRDAFQHDGPDASAALQQDVAPPAEPAADAAAKPASPPSSRGRILESDPIPEHFEQFAEAPTPYLLEPGAGVAPVNVQDQGDKTAGNQTDPDPSNEPVIEPHVEEPQAVGEEKPATEGGETSFVTPLSAKIAALEAVIGKRKETWEPDGVAEDPYSGTAEPAMEWANRDGQTVQPAEMSAAGSVDETAADAFPPKTPLPEVVAQDIDMTEPHELLDEDMLRDLVAEIVRQELQGALGERITRNVRKLVRREIHRALATHELD